MSMTLILALSALTAQTSADRCIDGRLSPDGMVVKLLCSKARVTLTLGPTLWRLTADDGLGTVDLNHGIPNGITALLPQVRADLRAALAEAGRLNEGVAARVVAVTLEALSEVVPVDGLASVPPEFGAGPEMVGCRQPVTCSLCFTEADEVWRECRRDCSNLNASPECSPACATGYAHAIGTCLGECQRSRDSAARATKSRN